MPSALRRSKLRARRHKAVTVVAALKVLSFESSTAVQVGHRHPYLEKKPTASKTRARTPTETRYGTPGSSFIEAFARGFQPTPRPTPLSYRTPTPNRPGVCLRVRCGMVLRVTGLRLRAREVRRAEMPSALRRSKRAGAYIYIYMGGGGYLF